MKDGDTAASAAPAVGVRRRWFTVEQANRALPLVGRIAGDVVAQHEELGRLQKARSALGQTGPREQIEPIEQRAGEVVARLNDLIDELGRIGCDLKDLQSGLVDFPGRRNGKGILLCWKPGERRVEYWHEANAGFAGRRPVDEACE